MAIIKKKGSAGSGSEHEKLSIALDIGSYRLRMIAGHITDDRQIKVRGYLECPSSGVSKGGISDIDKLAAAVAYLIQEFQNKFGITVNHVITGVPGVYISSENQTGTATVQSGLVTIADRNRAVKNAEAGIRVINLTDYSIIHSTPQTFGTELSGNIFNPVGQYARRLEVNTHIIACQNFYQKNIELVIKKTSPDITPSSMVYVGNAASASVLTESDKEIGVILIDIGSGSTSVTVFEGKKQLISFGVNDGGDYITMFIAKAYSISMADAELLKIRCGYASRYLMSEEEAMTNTQMRIEDPHDQTSEFVVNYGELADVINKALNTMFEFLMEKIYSSLPHNAKLLEIGGGFVLTGGGANLYGIDKVLQSILPKYRDNPSYSRMLCKERVRIGHPNGITAAPDCGIDLTSIRDSSRAVVTGLLRSARFEDRKQYLSDTEEDLSSEGTFKKIFKGIKKWAKDEF